MTEDLKKRLEEKKKRLKAYYTSCSDANCVGMHSSGTDVNRAMEIEDLEDEIRSLEEKLASG